jgi:PRTRC genetic system protein B
MFSVPAHQSYGDYSRPNSVEIKTSFALVFHSVDDENVITKHNIIDNKIGAGIVVDPIDVIHNAVEISEQTHTTLLPSNVLVDNAQQLVWHVPGRNMNMWFQIRGTKQIALRVWWPNLVFVCNKQTRTLRVFATATASRPHAATPLYHAPLMNINTTGHLCLGSAVLPQTLTVNTIKQIEACLFDSNFSEVHGFKDTKYPYSANKKAHLKFYRERQKTAQKFTAKDLRPFKRLHELLG